MLLLIILAAVVISGAILCRPSAQALMLCLELCDFPGNFPIAIEPRGNSSRSRVPQFTGGYQFWIDGNKNETLHASNPRGLIEI